MNRKLLLLFVLFGTGSLFAQYFQGRVSTAVYTFERADSAKQKYAYVRGYQSVTLDYRVKSFSLHSSLNYENGYQNSLNQDGKLRLYNLYAEYKLPMNLFAVRIGRQSVYKAAAGGIFDGISLKSEFAGVRLDLYGGGNVPAYQKAEFTESFSDDRLFGAEISAPILYGVHAKAGYVDKAYKPVEYTALRLDEAFNPVQLLIRQNSNQFKYVYGILNYEYSSVVFADTKFEYDLNLKKASSFELTSSYQINRKVGVTAYYQYREPRIRYNSIFSVFNYMNTQEVEVGADYRLKSDISFSGRLGLTTYTDENASRITVASTYKFLTASYRMTFGVAGEQTAATLSAGRSYFSGKLGSTAALSFVSYKEVPDSEAETLFSGVLGLTYRPLRELSFDVQGQYMHNNIYKNDMRVLFRAAYWFHTKL